MGAIGPTELLLIAGVIILLFGAGRIAEIGKGLGEGIRNFKLGIREAISDEPDQLPEHASDEEADPDGAGGKRSRKVRAGLADEAVVRKIA